MENSKTVARVTPLPNTVVELAAMLRVPLADLVSLTPGSAMGLVDLMRLRMKNAGRSL